MRALVVCAALVLVFDARADEVLGELSRRTLISEKELRELLRNCEGTQLSMNICAARDFVKVDLTMKSLLNAQLQSLPDSCGDALREKQAAWERARDESCDKKANDLADGGTMRPMIFSSCQATATKTRISELKAVVGCSTIR